MLLTLELVRLAWLPTTNGPSPSFVTFIASAQPFVASTFTFVVSEAAFKPIAFIAVIVAFMLSTFAIVAIVMRWVGPC